MRFQYALNVFLQDSDDSRTPTAIKLVDFQISRISIPVCDLSHFLYSCTSTNILNNLDEYLRIYYESFSSHLRKLGSDSEELFPYHLFMDQWKKYSKYGLLMALFIIPLMLCDSDESPEISDFFETGKAAEGNWDSSLRNVDEYKKRIKDLVLFMYNSSYL